MHRVRQPEVLMGYDSKNLYIAFNVKQDKEKVRATVARRDDIFNDDFVGVYLDTFNDQRQAYILLLIHLVQYRRMELLAKVAVKITALI